MKTFKTLAIVKYPRALVWTTVRDHLPELVPHLADIADVEIQSRDESTSGIIRLVNFWRAETQIPSILKSVVTPEMLSWTDRAEWRPDTWECRWQIQPYFVAGGAQCNGVTRYEEAMAGRGTRLVYEGNLDLSTARVSGVPALVTGASASAIEAFVAGLIPRNFQKLAQAVSHYLQSDVI
jgi:hypothetical protein